MRFISKQLDLEGFHDVSAFEIPEPGRGFVLRTALEQYEFDGRSAPRSSRWEPDGAGGLPRGIVHWVKRMVDGKTRFRQFRIVVSLEALELTDCRGDDASEPRVTLKPSPHLPRELLEARLSEGYVMTVLVDEYERVGCCGELVLRRHNERSDREHLEGARLPLALLGHTR